MYTINKVFLVLVFIYIYANVMLGLPVSKQFIIVDVPSVSFTMYGNFAEYLFPDHICTVGMFHIQTHFDLKNWYFYEYNGFGTARGPIYLFNSVQLLESSGCV